MIFIYLIRNDRFSKKNLLTMCDLLTFRPINVVGIVEIKKEERERENSGGEK